ncbi:MAG: 2-amino-4-hydroxy-6-hydroxymethyldihydropteridine diphosphokinase [Carboxylicivirga sp.]|jgi:2-amino-4-hydroxy-6-hydroxymethyldihydropteridine diphosphokinase|nr:2-amino-4-hydroxy-6-hydroxymethyldihydropteridine diphosphokinase [Carboxylicivirga sp.]
MTSYKVVIIGIGSNIEAEANIPSAIVELQNLGELQKESEVLITKPIGISEQNDFSNAAVLMKVNHSLTDLTKELKSIEDKLGRDRSRPKFGPREIDLDVLMFDGEIVDEDYYTRDFLQILVDQVKQKK